MNLIVCLIAQLFFTPPHSLDADLLDATYYHGMI
jgi:hypothetical protein